MKFWVLLLNSQRALKMSNPIEEYKKELLESICRRVGIEMELILLEYSKKPKDQNYKIEYCTGIGCSDGLFPEVKEWFDTYYKEYKPTGHFDKITLHNHGYSMVGTAGCASIKDGIIRIVGVLKL